MEKINIAGYEFNNFGLNNYSNGMKLITSTDRPLEIIEKVKLQEPGFENIWLNPSAPCSEFEFFGVLGTEEQYKEFYERQKDCQVAKILIEKLGGMESLMEAPMKVYSKAREEAYNEYKDWWDE